MYRHRFVFVLALAAFALSYPQAQTSRQFVNRQSAIVNVDPALFKGISTAVERYSYLKKELDTIRAQLDALLGPATVAR